MSFFQDKAEASEASLKEKKFLEELTLSWKNSPESDGRIDEEVIKGLEPPPNLNELMIESYKGIGSPEWLLNDGRFLRLAELTIRKCHKLERVPSLPSTLIRLTVSVCENLKEMSSLPMGLRVVVVQDCPNLMQLSPFPPNLEDLYIEGCPGVETLLSNILLFEGEEDEHPNHEQQEKDNQQHFPLKTLSIKSCSVSGKKRLFSDPNKLFTSLTTLRLRELPWLTSLFPANIEKLSSLSYLVIGDCPKMELLPNLPSSLEDLWISGCHPQLKAEYEEGGPLRHKLQHIPRVIIG